MIPHLPLEDISVPCLVPESEIRAFVGNLRIRESQAVLARLLVVTLAAIELMKNKHQGKSENALLMLIKQVAREDKDKRYRHIMDEIVSSLSSDKEGEEWMRGFESAFMTLTRTIEYINELLPETETLLRMYIEKLEEVRQSSRIEKKL
jgi:hypothetical protein